MCDIDYKIRNESNNRRRWYWVEYAEKQVQFGESAVQQPFEIVGNCGKSAGYRECQDGGAGIACTQ
jgi:hypothetical protein